MLGLLTLFLWQAHGKPTAEALAQDEESPGRLARISAIVAMASSSRSSATAANSACANLTGSPPAEKRMPSIVPV